MLLTWGRRDDILSLHLESVRLEAFGRYRPRVGAAGGEERKRRFLSALKVGYLSMPMWKAWSPRRLLSPQAQQVSDVLIDHTISNRGVTDAFISCSFNLYKLLFLLTGSFFHEYTEAPVSVLDVIFSSIFTGLFHQKPRSSSRSTP